MVMFFLTMLFSVSFGSSAEIPVKLTQEKFEELKDDKVFLDILSQEIKIEENKIIRNKVILKNTEQDLDLTIRHGLTEKEFCIRQGISALRTIDYVYNWILEQVSTVKYEQVKLSTIETLDRMRNLNKIFSDRTLRIEECKLKISAKVKNLKNEMISDRVDTKMDVIKNNVEIPVDYPAARAPFR